MKDKRGPLNFAIGFSVLLSGTMLMLVNPVVTQGTEVLWPALAFGGLATTIHAIWQLRLVLPLRTRRDLCVILVALEWAWIHIVLAGMTWLFALIGGEIFPYAMVTVALVFLGFGLLFLTLVRCSPELNKPTVSALRPGTK